MPRATGEFARLLETRDDAAVIAVSDDLCLVQTVDFFTPIVDSPFWFGQIAAANALSDIYAMGARPLTAMNLVAWPVDVGLEPLAEILRGGAEKVAEAGAELAGGHSIDDKEPKYGLAVTGVARPDEIVYNGGARPGDKLVLTKRLGIGVLASALKKGLIAEAEMMPAIEEAAALNAAASQAMLAVGVHAATDVSGFGLLGHLGEMLDATNVGGTGATVAGTAQSAAPISAILDLAALPLHERVLDFIRGSIYAGGLKANRDYLIGRLGAVDESDPRVLALCDPQTSGGLLIAVSPEKHARLLEELAARGAGAFTVGEVVAASATRAGRVALARQ
jgi:selenide,water dikinase